MVYNANVVADEEEKDWWAGWRDETAKMIFLGAPAAPVHGGVRVGWVVFSEG